MLRVDSFKVDRDQATLSLANDKGCAVLVHAPHVIELETGHYIITIHVRKVRDADALDQK